MNQLVGPDVENNRVAYAFSQVNLLLNNDATLTGPQRNKLMHVRRLLSGEIREQELLDQRSTNEAIDILLGDRNYYKGLWEETTSLLEESDRDKKELMWMLDQPNYGHIWGWGITLTIALGILVWSFFRESHKDVDKTEIKVSQLETTRASHP